MELVSPQPSGSGSKAAGGDGANGGPVDGGQVKRRSAWNEFCKSTAIHGLRYLAEDHRSPSQKAFWATSIVLSLIGCGALLARMYMRWEETPAIATNEIKMRAVWELPFPAVTICPQIKVATSIYLQQANLSDSDLDREMHRLNKTKSLICENPALGDNRKNILVDDVDFLVSVAPQMADVVRGFRWKGADYTNVDTNVTGADFWSPVLTDEGLCFTINMLNAESIYTESAVQRSPPLPTDLSRQSAKGWSLERGYDPNVTVDESYPMRALRGAKGGVAMLLMVIIKDMDYACRGPVQGFKVLLHNPAEPPHMKHATRVMLGEELVVHVKTSTMSTADELRPYDPQARQCYFDGERSLRYFQIYTKKNCELECSSNFSRNACGCVAFYMPRSEDVPICGPGSLECLHAAEEMLVLKEIETENRRRAGLSLGPHQSCECLQACTSVEYDADTNRADFSWEKSVSAWRFTDPLFVGKDCARVSVHFKDSAVVVSTQRSELYSLEKFFAACAAGLGLFTGFSLIDMCDAAYFMTLGLLLRVYRKCGHLFGKKDGDRE